MTESDERDERLLRELKEIRNYIISQSKYFKKLEKIYIIPTFETVKTLVNILEYFTKLKTAFVCADPHATWNGHLNGANSEGEQIQAVLQDNNYTVTLKRHPVNKAEFLSDVGGKTIVHLAGHGDFSGGQVYFCFNDINVYPSDIAELDSVPSLLFYAGVCLGGVNDTMARVFIEKGTQYYIGFTQSIPDMAAKYFGDLFYEKWLVEEKDIRVALDEADDDYPGLNCWVLWED